MNAITRSDLISRRGCGFATVISTITISSVAEGVVSVNGWSQVPKYTRNTIPQ